MKILLCSPLFYPSVGGVETVNRLLAEQFTAMGHEIRVVCETPGGSSEISEYKVYRRPTYTEWNELLVWCDLYYQSSVSLRYLWPLLLHRRPYVVTHHTYYDETGFVGSLRSFLKRHLCRLAWNTTVSLSIAETLPVQCKLVPNPYEHSRFRILSEGQREEQLVFVGRLVSDKGVDILLRALLVLNERGRKYRLSIAGDGAERRTLEAMIKELGLQDQVQFLGSVTGDNLVRLLNRHRIQVIPSRWKEPFGVVALEGIACGCYIIGSSGGGLPGAIGECGTTFPNNDVEALSQKIQMTLDNSLDREIRPEQRESHLRHYRLADIAQEYLAFFSEALRH